MSETTQTKVLYALGDDCVSLDQLTARHPDVGQHALANAASRLLRKDLIERVEAGCFQLTAEGRLMVARGETITSGPNGPISVDPRPVATSQRQRAWTVIRMRRKFSIGELAVALAATGGASPKKNLQRYCYQLQRAGLIRILPGRGEFGAYRYALVRDPGPIAPSYLRARNVLFDHNARVELPLGEACA